MPRKSTIPVTQNSLFAIQTQNYSLNTSEVYKQVSDKEEWLQFLPMYCRQNGILFTSDSIKWLKMLKSGSIDLIFAASPYNIKKPIGTHSIHKNNILHGQ